MLGKHSDERSWPLVLLIENDENDVFLFRRALGKLDWVGHLRVVRSVSEARAYMENTFGFQDQGYYRRPNLIVSDYRLNSQTALDFSQWFHAQPHCEETPLVILTGVSSGIPPEQLTQFRAAGFIVKTADVQQLGESLKQYLP